MRNGVMGSGVLGQGRSSVRQLLLVPGSRRRIGQHALMGSDVEGLVAVVLTVSDLDRAVALYGDGFGLELHIDDHQGDDHWTSGRHAATSWTEGTFMHFALYEA